MKTGMSVTRKGIAYDERVIAMLVRDGWLAPSDSSDKDAIWAAIDKMVRDAAEDRGGWRMLHATMRMMM
jgi:hypothetical protein